MRQFARTVIIAAALLGIAGDAVMRGGMLRLGFTMWIVAVAIAALAIGGPSLGANPSETAPDRSRLFLLGGTVLASLGLVLRDSPTLFAVDFLSVLCMGALTIWHSSGRRIGELTVIESIRAALLAVINSIAGAVGVVQHARGDAKTVGDGDIASSGRLRSIAIGIVLAVPPLLIVTSLLNSSDVVFKGLIDRVVTFLKVDGVEHALVALALAWVTAGWLRAALGFAVRLPIPEVKSPGLPFVSVGVALFALVALLTLFLATQIRVLFGGEAFLLATQGLTVANYAREGFFQLIVASGVVLGTLIAAEFLLAAGDARGRRQFRLTGAALLVLVLLLLTSAATRMVLYLREFGLSIDRAFACAVMLWVVAAIVIFAGTMLHGRADRFAPITLLVTVVWVALLNVINLESMVVEVNAVRAVRGRPFDASYHAALSADALPALLIAADKMTPEECQVLSTALKTAWSKRLADPADGGQDWRALDLPLQRAKAWYEDGAKVCP